MTRVTDQNTTLRCVCLTQNQSTGLVLDNIIRERPVLVGHVERDDVRRTPVTGGWRPPLPYAASGYSLGYGFIQISSAYVFQGAPILTSWYGTTAYKGTDWTVRASPTASLISQADKDRAVIGMLNRIGDQKWAAGEALAELGSSLKQIENAANRLSKALLYASQRKWGRVAKVLGVKPKTLGELGKNPASGFLAYVFGWQPIVEDMAQAMLYLSGYSRKDKLIIAAHSALQASTGKRKLRTSSIGESVSATGQQVGQFFDVVEESTDEWKASVYYEVEMGALRDLQAYGLVGLSTPWAVTPLSFLYDWVVPIGDFLAAMDATLGLSYIGGSFTSYQKVIREHIPGNLFHNTPRKSVDSGGIVWSPGTSWNMRRTVWQSSPLPFPAYIKNPFSPFKAAASTALLAQRIGTVRG